ncbi:GntR family transcriptional regulator [Salipaludibacillus daqingensis]|uniref:GntR family transcriptional regulator n=1 Tax=Salipaludibacillus daqingensis TaxID=3041001 RepID=UPI002475B6FA|nr:GntR family transcriptional regulator [Salipaludibacillus daqingensis]
MILYFQINPKNNTPLYEQLIHQVKEMYAKGLLKPNEKLPSVRELSSQMVINPNTVSKAYQELERQGVITTVRGKGTFVSEELIQSHTPQQEENLKQSFKQVIIDSYYAGFSKQELLRWFNDVYEEMEGENDES